MSVDTKSPKIGSRTPRQAAQKGIDSPLLHVLVRARSEDGLTIGAHSKMIAARGSALFGKLGKPVGPAFRRALNAQIERGHPTFLFLTMREGWNGEYVTYRCALRGVSETLDPAKRLLVPSYYISHAPQIATWFEIAGLERLTRDEMNRIFVISSGRSLMGVIKSTAAVFCVGMR